MGRVIILFGFLFFLIPGNGYSADTSTLRIVEDLLVAKGFDRKETHSILSNPGVTLDKSVIIRSLKKPGKYITAEKASKAAAAPVQKVSAANGSDAPKKDALIKKCQRFIIDNSDEFSLLQEKYNVSPMVITAILVVETKLGKYCATNDAFDAFVIMSACLDPYFYDSFASQNIEKYPYLAEPSVKEEARKRGVWAAGELARLMEISVNLKLDPLKIRGSYAGALGPAQFIPSTFVNYGMDGNGDGIKDPFCMSDAMASIAYYMKKAGWKDGDGYAKEQRTAIWIYNHSNSYVENVYSIYLKLLKAREDEFEVAKGESN